MRFANASYCCTAICSNKFTCRSKTSSIALSSMHIFTVRSLSIAATRSTTCGVSGGLLSKCCIAALQNPSLGFNTDSLSRSTAGSNNATLGWYDCTAAFRIPLVTSMRWSKMNLRNSCDCGIARNKWNAFDTSTSIWSVGISTNFSRIISTIFNTVGGSTVSPAVCRMTSKLVMEISSDMSKTGHRMAISNAFCNAIMSAPRCIHNFTTFAYTAGVSIFELLVSLSMLSNISVARHGTLGDRTILVAQISNKFNFCLIRSCSFSAKTRSKAINSSKVLPVDASCSVEPSSDNAIDGRAAVLWMARSTTSCDGICSWICIHFVALTGSCTRK